MAYKEVQRVDISEVVRRWQAGGSRRRIASGTGLSRETVGKYIALAEGLGVSREGPTPTEEQLGRLAAISRPGPQHGAVPTEDRLAPWADQIYQWLTGGRLQLTRVQELLAQRGCPVSYASLQRFVARRNWRGRSRSTVRMEDTAPGEVAEVDFGRLGLVHDPETGRRRTVWALVSGAGLLQAQLRLAHLQPEAGVSMAPRSWATGAEQECQRRSLASVKVRTGTWSPVDGRFRRLRRLPAVALMGLSRRSRMDALAASSRRRTWGSRSRCPCRSMDSTRLGSAAFSRLPQIRSAASQITITASRTASS